MTTKEIMELLLEGKKIRQNDWASHTYIRLDEKGNLIGYDGQPTSISFYLSDIWEEYIEYVDFVTAMKHIINGGKAKRKDRSFYISLQNRNEIRIVLYKDDILTEDWILL